MPFSLFVQQREHRPIDFMRGGYPGAQFLIVLSLRVAFGWFQQLVYWVTQHVFKQPCGCRARASDRSAVGVPARDKALKMPEAERPWFAVLARERFDRFGELLQGLVPVANQTF